MSGLAELRARAARLPAELSAIAGAAPPLKDRELDRIAGLRAVVTTGIGSSRAHAEFLAECLALDAGWPARFSSTGALEGGPPTGCERDLLIVFSQGLSPNARFALQSVERWGAVLLVTAEADPRVAASGTPGDAGTKGTGRLEPAAKAEKRAWLEALDRLGVVIVRMPGEDEYGTLVRITGPVAGFAVALELAAQLATSRGLEPRSLEWDAGAVGRAFAGAGEKCDRSLAGVRPERCLEHPVVFVASGGHAQAAGHLATRFSESLWIPRPACWDALEFAHGPLQEIYDRPATVFFLAREGSAVDRAAIESLRRVLVEERHRLIVWSSELPGRAALFEHEALAIEFAFRVMEARQFDPAQWPGKGKDGPLYGRAPSLPQAAAAKHLSARAPSELAAAHQPEIEAFLRAGGRTAVVPLGSTEQHGPHLPFATDTWIAEAVAARFCARRQDALAIPALPIGCASEHMAFPGTLDLRPETLESVLGDLLASLASHGFARALVFSAHGGNAAALESMRPRLGRRAAPMQLAVYADLARLSQTMQRASASQGVAPEAAGHHAGESETSIVLALEPGSVRRARFATGTLAGSDAQALFYPSLRERAPTGVVGDPRAAHAARAAVYLDAWVDELERFCRDSFGN